MADAMIHAFEISHNERKLFEKFMQTHGATVEYKLRDSGTVYHVAVSRDWATKSICYDKTMNILVLFRDRLDCEFTEMAWNMLKDEIQRNTVAMAA